MHDSTKLYKLKLRKNSRLELKMNERLIYKCSFKILSIFWNCQGLCSNRVSSAGWWGGGEGVVLREEKGKGLDSPRLHRE